LTGSWLFLRIPVRRVVLVPFDPNNEPAEVSKFRASAGKGVVYREDNRLCTMAKTEMTCKALSTEARFRAPNYMSGPRPMPIIPRGICKRFSLRRETTRIGHLAFRALSPGLDVLQHELGATIAVGAPHPSWVELEVVPLHFGSLSSATCCRRQTVQRHSTTLPFTADLFTGLATRIAFP
jgi:hypothetical protein